MASPENHYILETVRLFIKNPRPTLVDKARIEELVLGHMERLPMRDAQAICAELAQCAHMPLSLFLKLCALPIGICRPLLASPCHHSTAELHGIIEADIEKARILARNSELHYLTVEKLRDLNDRAIDRSLDLRQRPTTNYQAYETVEPAPSQDRGHPLSTEYLLQTLEDPNDVLIHTALSDLLGLSLESIAALCSDATSRNLPTALHFLRLSIQEAWSVYARLVSTRSDCDEIKIAFETVYSQLDLRTSQTIVNGWQIDELVAIVKANGAANDASNSRILRSA